MRLLAFSFFVLLGSFAAAQTPTKYDRIKELYDTGQPVTLAELNNVWNGRCFHSTERNEARRASFGLPEVNDVTAGPEFESEMFRILVFDTYETARSKNDAIDNYRSQVILPTEMTGAVELSHDGVQLSIRKNGAYMMVFNVSEDIHCYFYELLK